MIFKGVLDGKPYPTHGLSHRQWSQIPPRQIRLDELVMTTTVLALDRLLSEDSTFYGDLFPHAVRWRGVIYLEDGLHRAVRAALRNRTVLHARVFDMDIPLATADVALPYSWWEGPPTNDAAPIRLGRYRPLAAGHVQDCAVDVASARASRSGLRAPHSNARPVVVR